MMRRRVGIQHCGHFLVSVKFLLFVDLDVGLGSTVVGLGVGVGVSAGSRVDKHPEKPIAAIAPANARDLRNLRLPIFMVLVSYCPTQDIKLPYLTIYSVFLPVVRNLPLSWCSRTS